MTRKQRRPLFTKATPPFAHTAATCEPPFAHTAVYSRRYLADAGTDSALHDSVNDCTNCLQGTYAAAAGTATCTTCPGGKYLSDEATDAALHDSVDDCSNCTAGRYGAALYSHAHTPTPVTHVNFTPPHTAATHVC